MAPDGEAPPPPLIDIEPAGADMSAVVLPLVLPLSELIAVVNPLFSASAVVEMESIQDSRVGTRSVSMPYLDQNIWQRLTS